MQSDIDRLTGILAEHLGSSPETATILALEYYIRYNQGSHLLRGTVASAIDAIPKPTSRPKLPNGINPFKILSFGTYAEDSEKYFMEVECRFGSIYQFEGDGYFRDEVQKALKSGGEYPPVSEFVGKTLHMTCAAGFPTRLEHTKYRLNLKL